MRVSTEQLILFLPFDDENGTVYDYSRSRVTIPALGSGYSLTDDAVLGKALQIESTAGDTLVNSDVLDLTGEWTVAHFIKPGGTDITFLVNYYGSGQYQQHIAPVTAGEWVFVALQRYLSGETYRIRAMVNTTIVYDEACLGVPSGIDMGDFSGSTVVIDELKMWNRALSLVELNYLQRFDDDVEYYINGKNFKDFGVEVSNSSGLLDWLKRKEPTEVDWPDYHGKVMDLNNPRYEAREIELECFIVATNNMNFVMWLRKFMEEFQFKGGVQRLTCVYGPASRPLVYDVYLDDKVGIDKTWNEEPMVGTFTLHLVEPSPVKKVLRHSSSDTNSYAVFQLTSSKKISVTWGDHDATETDAKACEVSTDGLNWTTPDRTNPSSNLSGTGLWVRHRYTMPGDYDIVIHGVVEKITNFQTNEIIMYDRLA